MKRSIIRYGARTDTHVIPIVGDESEQQYFNRQTFSPLQRCVDLIFDSSTGFVLKFLSSNEPGLEIRIAYPRLEKKENKDLYILDFEIGFRIRPKYQNIEGSLSTSSKQIFATKYLFCSIFRDLMRSTRCANFCTAPSFFLFFAPLHTNFLREKHVQYFKF